MENLQSIILFINLEDWMLCRFIRQLLVPIHPQFLYQFQYLPFGLYISLRIFTKVLQSAIATGKIQ